jgi:chromosome segregation ATPase
MFTVMCNSNAGHSFHELSFTPELKGQIMQSEPKVLELPKVTARTTRAELLKAYNLALQKLAEATSGEESIPAEEPLPTTLSYTEEGVIKSVAELQVTIGKALKDLTEKMVAESDKLSALRKAIENEKLKLKQVYDIEYQLQSLAALIEAQSERKAALEKDMASQRQEFEAAMVAKREEWKQEQHEHEQDVKDRDLGAKRQRERDEEEYRFKISIERRKEAAEYEAQKVELQRQLEEEQKKVERELAARRETLAAQEAELVELRKRVERFPKELEEAVKKTEQSLRSALQQQHDFEAKLSAKEAETEKRVNAMKVASLEELVAKQQAQIADLTKQLQAATKQVQEMAVKAIESASGKGRPLNGDSPAQQRKTA